MRTLLRAEARKALYTRSFWLLPAIGVAVSVTAATVLVAAFKQEEIATHLSRHGPLRFGASNAGLVIALCGIRIFGDEVHNGTLASTLIRQPQRLRLLAAKAVVALAIAVGVTVATYAIVVPLTVVILDARGMQLVHDWNATGLLFGRVGAAMALLALVAVGLAGSLRNRTVALVTYLLWILLGETIVGGVLKAPEYMPTATVEGLVTNGGADSLGASAAALWLAAYALVALAGAALALRRDVD